MVKIFCATPFSEVPFVRKSLRSSADFSLLCRIRKVFSELCRVVEKNLYHEAGEKVADGVKCLVSRASWLTVDVYRACLTLGSRDRGFQSLGLQVYEGYVVQNIRTLLT